MSLGGRPVYEQYSNVTVPLWAGAAAPLVTCAMRINSWLLTGKLETSTKEPLCQTLNESAYTPGTADGRASSAPAATAEELGVTGD
jgi:hypothetical protein